MAGKVARAARRMGRSAPCDDSRTTRAQPRHARCSSCPQVDDRYATPVVRPAPCASSPPCDEAKPPAVYAAHAVSQAPPTAERILPIAERAAVPPPLQRQDSIALWRRRQSPPPLPPRTSFHPVHRSLSAPAPLPGPPAQGLAWGTHRPRRPSGTALPQAPPARRCGPHDLTCAAAPRADYHRGPSCRRTPRSCRWRRSLPARRWRARL
mmetsp:Transcript_2085/g.5223  ORF Transcript_2085/g.5223 Transcript_2085/m.5223 type:complete len:209 (+) Transcript_2085:1136-1762(+)